MSPFISGLPPCLRQLTAPGMGMTETTTDRSIENVVTMLVKGRISQFELKDRVFVGTDVCISILGAVFAAVTKPQMSPALVRDGSLWV